MVDSQENLIKFDEKIDKYDKLIIFQRNEISKTEKLISDFQSCLFQQNAALKGFITEKELLVSEKTKFFESANTTVGGCKKIIQEEVKVPVPNQMTKNEIKPTNGDVKKSDGLKYLKRKITNDDSALESKIPCMESKTLKIRVEKLEVSEIKNKTIHKIVVYDKDIYIAGSEGLLLRHTPEYTHIYDTNTKEDIKQIQVIKNKNKDTLSINVFTDMKLIFYQDVTWYTKREEIDIPEIGEVFLDSNLLYIPFKNGLIKKLEDNTMKKAPNLKGPIRSFVHCSETSKLALIVPEDKLLYTTNIMEPRKLRVIRGPINIQGVRKILKRYFVSHSRRDIWLLNCSFQILHNVTFKNIILFVEVFEGFVVVVDKSNTVHLLSLFTKSSLDVKTVYTHSFDGTITSVAFSDHTVYVSVDNEIIVVKYNF